MFESDGESDYHALRSGLRRRFNRGFSLNVSHVWSHMIDTTGTSFLAEGTSNAKRDVHNRAAERGNSIFDARHRLVVSYVVELPFQGPVFGGWQLSGVTTFQTGTPVDAGLSFDNANTGSVGDNRPDLVGDPNTGPKTPQQWFNTAAFATPVPFTFGTTGKNVITGPGISASDFSVTKNMQLAKTARCSCVWRCSTCSTRRTSTRPTRRSATRTSASSRPLARRAKFSSASSSGSSRP